jgi:hypothetical protein
LRPTDEAIIDVISERIGFDVERDDSPAGPDAGLKLPPGLFIGAWQDQPRAPAGTPEGGQWISEGGWSSRSGFSLVRETEKAMLVEHKDFGQVWVPKSQAALEGDKLKVKDWLVEEKFGSLPPQQLRIKKETEKAVLVRAWGISPHSSLPDPEREIWLPKSQLKKTEDGRYIIPRWLAQAKAAEMELDLPPGASVDPRHMFNPH